MKKFAEKTIRSAGEILRKKFHNVKKISTKSSLTDVVTEADFLSQRLIVKAIKEKYPEHDILAEEAPHLISQDADHLWIIDPLDGTRNFASGIPFYAITMSYKEKGQTKLGLIYDVWHDELFYAEKGGGAYMNNKKIKVSSTDKVDSAMISFDFTRRDKKIVSQVVASYQRLLEKKCWITGHKCAALSLAYAACGRVDVSTLLDLAIWDIDAGVLIGQEAGAKVELFEAKNSDSYYKYRVLMANPKLFKKIRNKYISLAF